MQDPDIRAKAKKDRNWLQETLRGIPGFRGYLEKEERRNTDKILREHLARKLERVRKELDPVMRELSDRGGMETFGAINELDRVKKALEKLVGRVRYASYGYSGVFDAVKVREKELDRLYRFDVALLERVEEVENTVKSLTDADLTAEELKQRVEDALRLCREFDEHFDSRQEMLSSESSEE